MGINIGSGVQQQLNNTKVSFPGSTMERSRTIHIPRGDQKRVLFKELLHPGNSARLRGPDNLFIKIL
jgi:hypothetical protein